MYNYSNIDLAANLVFTKRRPGALIDLYVDQLHETELTFLLAGLASVRGRRRNDKQNIAVSFNTPASMVIDTSEIIKSTTPQFGDFEEIMEHIGTKNVAEALIFLNNVSGDPQNESAQPAILEGALLGYENCDITYHALTRYLGEKKDPRSDMLNSRGIPAKLWPDRHLLCGSCAVAKMIELDSSYNTTYRE